MAKRTFIASTKTIETAKGKMQFNTASETFRKAMQWRYNAECSLAEAKATAQDRLTAIANTIHVLEGSAHFNTADVEALNTEAEAVRAAFNAMREEVNSARPDLTEADLNLYYAYRTYINGEEDSSTSNTYERAFYEWADSNGLKPTRETFSFITRKIGAKVIGAKSIIKYNGEKFTDAEGKNKFFRVFYAVIMEILRAQNLLKGFKFTYQFPEKQTKKTAI